MNAIHRDFQRQGLVRPQDDRLFAGVCAGVARRFGMDPWAVVALFALSLVVIPGSQVLVHPVLWLLVPEEQTGYVPAVPADGPTA